MVAAFGLAAALMESPETKHQESIVYCPASTKMLFNRTGRLTGKSSAGAQDVAQSFIEQHLGRGEWVLRSKYVTKFNGVTHMAFRRHFDGVECSNCDVVVNVDKQGQVLNMGYTDVPTSALEATRKKALLTDPVRAIAAFVEYAKIMPAKLLSTGDSILTLGEDATHTFTFPELAKATATEGKATAKQTYYFDADKAQVVPVWEVELDTELPHASSYTAWMHAETSERVAVQDHVNWDSTPQGSTPEQGTYQVYSPPHIDPFLGDRTTEKEAESFKASPLGWNQQSSDGELFTNTIGNNVYAQENHDGNANWRNNYRPSNPDRDFSFPIDLTKEPRTYVDASILNLFYWNNLVHDVFYKYGFDEVSGNFQENNFDQGGLGDDAVQANAQDGAGFNNANMLTRVDGQRGRMRMYLWNVVSPMRDGDLDSAIIVHEYGHGISHRLTGGPATVRCLSGGQSGGMGEGWGDYWGVMFNQEAHHVRSDEFPLGLYAANRGSRPFPYSGDMEVNPQTYGFLTRSGYRGVHAIGSVWAATLFHVYWAMRDSFGFDPDWHNGDGGNNKLFRNVVDGEKLQPCQPNFIQARDAILQADKVNYEGRHYCTMYIAFAERGLGVSAQSSRNSNSECEARASH